jgi:hypothetical protein
MDQIEIFAIEKSTNKRQRVRRNGTTILTTNLMSALADTQAGLTKANGWSLYYSSSTNVNSRILIYFMKPATSFFDITTPATLTNPYRLRYNHVSGKFYANIENYGYSRVSATLTEAGRTAFSSNLEQYLLNIYNPIGAYVSGLSGMTYLAGIFTITSVLNRLYLIKVRMSYPFDTLTINSKTVLRIRQTNITGPILSESSFYNSTTTSNNINIETYWIGLNPVNYCVTAHLETGSFTQTLTRSCNLLVSIREIN